MGKLKLQIADRLTQTAARLAGGAPYRWTHQGRCNLGHLIQTVTGLQAARIHQVAVQSQGEWIDHAANYCETSGLPVDALIKQVLELGLTLDEIADVERLASRKVLRWLPANRRHLDYRHREDVILYFETWAEVLRAEVSWERDPSVAYELNGRPYEPPAKPSRIENALDENPASGYAA